MTERRFLFLQGPHGPFFRQLSRRLRATGALVWRVGFNAGDAAFWAGSKGYIPYRGGADEWSQSCARLLDEKAITDIVLYGDTRPVHATAIRLAKARGLHVHIFEEGYLRPYWVSYERGGSNGHSALMDIPLAAMTAPRGADRPVPPSHWGDLRHHIFYGALYHWCVMFLNARYPGFRRHRALPVHTEALLYSKRLLLMPFSTLRRFLATRAIKAGGFAYHLALLQLEHDASFQAHSPFETMQDFIDLVIGGFAKGAPAHHHLVFKAHPLESGQSPLRRLIRRAAKAHGVGGRVHYLGGGKLAPLLDEARSAVTVNSTAGQQVLWRGLPLKIFGTAVYDKPGFTSDQPLTAFFHAPSRPDLAAYTRYRDFLLRSSQLPGGFYSAKGRQQLLRHLVDKMLAPEGPYARALAAPEPARRLLKATA